MTDELQRIWKVAAMVELRDYPVIYLEGPRENKKNLCQDSLLSGQD
jgi:hypothetical protein